MSSMALNTCWTPRACMCARGLDPVGVAHLSPSECGRVKHVLQHMQARDVQHVLGCLAAQNGSPFVGLGNCGMAEIYTDWFLPALRRALRTVWPNVLQRDVREELGLLRRQGESSALASLGKTCARLKVLCGSQRRHRMDILVRV